MSRLKVLFHVNETEKWDTALGNITNLLKDAGEDGVDIAVLANGPSVEVFMDDVRVQAMKELAGKGAKFLACRNSLRNLCSGASACMDINSLPSFVEVVPAGITEIIRRQADGYAYVKP